MVFLRAQGIGNDNVILYRVRRVCGISDDDGGVGRKRGMDDASKGYEATTEASRIKGKDGGCVVVMTGQSN